MIQDNQQLIYHEEFAGMEGQETAPERRKYGKIWIYNPRNASRTE